MRRRVAVVLVAALAPGACGGDAAPKISSKADFIAAADRICVERDAKASKLAGVRSDADLGRLSGQLADIYDRAIGQVQALALPPGGARAGAAKFVRSTAALGKPVNRMKAASLRLESAARAKDAKALKEAGEQLQTSVNTVQALAVVADAAARGYGMRSCGASSPAGPVS